MAPLTKPAPISCYFGKSCSTKVSIWLIEMPKGPTAHDHLPVLPGLEALNPFYRNPKVYTPCFGGLGHINCPRAGPTTNEDPREILVSTNIVTEVWKLWTTSWETLPSAIHTPLQNRNTPWKSVPDPGDVMVTPPAHTRKLRLVSEP